MNSKHNFCSIFLMTVSILCFSISVLAQIDKPSSRFTISVFYNPSVNTYSVYGDTNLGSNATVKSHTGHNYGILSSYMLSSRLSIQTGISISDFGYDMEYSGRFYANGLYRYNVGYIEIPLEFKMIVTSPAKRIRVIPSIGGFIAFLTKDKRGSPEFVSGTTQISLENFDNFDQYAPLLGGLNIGCALSYSYSQKIVFEFQPITKIFFGQNTYAFTSGDNEWTHISSTGFRFSIAYKL
jgi:hypothetical protein